MYLSKSRSQSVCSKKRLTLCNTSTRSLGNLANKRICFRDLPQHREGDEEPNAGVGKEVRGRTHTFYQVLIDQRDCPYIVRVLRVAKPKSLPPSSCRGRKRKQ